MAFATHDRQLATINITPLVDVLLVVLVIFMVATPLFSRALPMQLPQRVRLVKNDFRHVWAGFDVAAALQLEHIALRTDHRPVGQPLEKGPL